MHLPKMTSATSIFPTIGSVRNVSEMELAAMSTKETLVQLLTHLAEQLQYADHKDLYTDAAERLSKIARKEMPWGWRYVQSVASGTVEPGVKFAKAVEALAVTFDNVPAQIATTSPVTVYAETGTVTNGALVMAASRRCALPTCTVVFVPNVPWRKLCPVCNPMRGRSESHSQGSVNP